MGTTGTEHTRVPERLIDPKGKRGNGAAIPEHITRCTAPPDVGPAPCDIPHPDVPNLWTRGTRALSSLIIILCALCLQVAAQPIRSGSVRVDTATFVDTARARPVPVAIYRRSCAAGDHGRVVLLSHGYNENKPGTYLNYSYLAQFLAEQGYVVISIQHDLSTDEPLAMKGNLRELRSPAWDRGARNIGFVLSEMQRRYPALDYAHTTLIGHSNGGDMSAFFTRLHPGIVENLITLDNRRMPLPRTKSPRILSLRSSDAPADEGVLPSPEEQANYGMRIIQCDRIEHNQMSDRATSVQRERITTLVLDFLNER